MGNIQIILIFRNKKVPNTEVRLAGLMKSGYVNLKGIIIRLVDVDQSEESTVKV
jgi:hypothetical protein